MFDNTPAGTDIRRLFLIINPISGTKSKAGLDSRLTTGLRSRGFEVEVAYTRRAGDASELARQAVENGFDGVLACGGDGTVNETARAMTGTGVAMGIIPAGSGNGLARHINIPVNPMDSLDIIAARCIRDCDYGSVNGAPFFCTFGMGFDATVSDKFAASGHRGKMTYVRSALTEFINYHPEKYRILADGEPITDNAYIVAVCNANQYGNNAYIAPGASITDGLLDLVVIPQMPRMRIAMLGMDLMCGTLTNHRGIIQRKVRNVVIERDTPGPAHRDGEPFYPGTRIEVQCHPAALRLFTNPDKEPFRPVITPIESMADDIGRTLRHFFE